MSQATTQDTLTLNLKKFAGANWLKGVNIQTSEFGLKVADILGFVFQGIYHIERDVLRDRSVWDQHKKISVTIFGEFATYDYNRLTLLFLACMQQQCVMEIHGSRSGYTKLVFWDSEPSHAYVVWENLFQDQITPDGYPLVFSARSELGMLSLNRQRWALREAGKEESIINYINVAVSYPYPIGFQKLAEIIKLSHQFAVRISVKGLSYRSLEVTFHQRSINGTSFYDKHPSFEQHLNTANNI